MSEYKTYKVKFSVYVSTEREIRAKNEAEARDIAEDLYDSLDADDFEDGWEAPDFRVRLIQGSDNG